MGWGSAASGFFEALNRGMARFWGTQTRDEATLETQGERALAGRREALAKLKGASDEEDDEEISIQLGLVNRFDTELRRVRRAATAQRTP